MPQFEKLAAYLLMTASIVIIWAATIPAWPLFIAEVLHAHDLVPVL